MVFQGSFKEVFSVFTESLKGVSRKFHECFKDDSGKFQGCFKKFLRVFHVRLKEVSSSWEFQGYFKEV